MQEEGIQTPDTSNTTTQSCNAFCRLTFDQYIQPMLMTRFEVIDADGSGSLEIAELVHGLLKLRGEAGTTELACMLGLLAK